MTPPPLAVTVHWPLGGLLQHPETLLRAERTTGLKDPLGTAREVLARARTEAKRREVTCILKEVGIGREKGCR